MIPKACIFDLDGTLVDSLRDIAEALNDCLALLGIPPRPVDDYRYLVGEGVPVLCDRAIGKTHPLLTNRLTELARAFYRVRPLKHTKPFPEIERVIGQLRDRGVKLAVLSNKPHELTVRVVNQFWTENTFEAIYGFFDEERRKPSPHFALKICEQLDVSPADTWVVGDTPTDVETAIRAGATAVGVTWGFRSRDDLTAAGAHFIVDSPAHLLDRLFDSHSPRR